MTESNRESRETVAQNLQQQLVAARYSVRRLGKETGIDERLLRRYVRAEHEPNARNLMKIAAVLGQSLEWFYENHDDGGPDG